MPLTAQSIAASVALDLAGKHRAPSAIARRTFADRREGCDGKARAGPVARFASSTERPQRARTTSAF